MANRELRTVGVEIPAGGDEAQSIGLDGDVRGFTGLLVGLAIGVTSWGLILLVWWLV